MTKFMFAEAGGELEGDDPRAPLVAGIRSVVLVGVPERAIVSRSTDHATVVRPGRMVACCDPAPSICVSASIFPKGIGRRPSRVTDCADACCTRHAVADGDIARLVHAHARYEAIVGIGSECAVLVDRG